MPSATKTTRTQFITPEGPSLSRKGAASHASHLTSRGLVGAVPENTTAARRPQPRAAAVRARTPVSPARPSHAEHVDALHGPGEGIDMRHSTDGLLDEDFDDFGCDLGTILRLANGP